MMTYLQKVIIYSIVIVLFPSFCLGDDVCQSWFNASKIPPDSSGCELKCETLIKDMSTFDCANRCEEFCKGKKCGSDSYWADKIKNGRPKDWDLTSEVSSNWTESEKAILMIVLNQLPDHLKAIPFEGFFRMKKSMILGNPGTTHNKSIAIYDRAFNNPYLSTSRIVAHELAHVLYLSLNEKERKNYEDSLGWKEDKLSGSARSGAFINSGAKDSPDEDFANNLDFFLFEPDKLKATVPSAYNWFKSKFPKDFKIKEDCQNEKKFKK